MLRRHEKLVHLDPPEPNDMHFGGPSTDPLPGAAPSRTSREDDEVPELTALNADTMGASEGKTLSCPI